MSGRNKMEPPKKHSKRMKRNRALVAVRGRRIRETQAVATEAAASATGTLNDQIEKCTGLFLIGGSPWQALRENTTAVTSPQSRFFMKRLDFN